MKKLLLIVTLLVLVFTLAAAPVVKLMRLEVVNKSAEPAYLKLQEVSWDASPQSYYLNIGEAASLPAVKLFTMVRGVYDVEAQYCDQEWATLFANLDLNMSQFRIVIPPCGQANVEDAVSDGALKLSPGLYPPVDLFEVPIIYDMNWRY